MGEEEKLVAQLRGRANVLESPDEGTPYMDGEDLRDAANMIESLRASLTRVEGERDFRGTRIAVAIKALRDEDYGKARAALEQCLSRADG